MSEPNSSSNSRRNPCSGVSPASRPPPAKPHLPGQRLHEGERRNKSNLSRASIITAAANSCRLSAPRSCVLSGIAAAPFFPMLQDGFRALPRFQPSDGNAPFLHAPEIGFLALGEHMDFVSEVLDHALPGFLAGQEGRDLPVFHSQQAQPVRG